MYFNNPLRGFLLILIFSLVNIETWSQRKADIGVFSGVSYYMGEINPARHMYKPSPAAGAICRYNFNPRNSLRVHAIYCNLRGDDLDFNNDFQQNRGLNFNTSCLDIAINTEFNFFPYVPGKRKDKISPYAAGGLGYSLIFQPDARGTNALVISWGAGLKFNVSRRVSSGFEWTFRKTFNDRIDGIENPGPEYNTFYHNNDWYSIVGIFVTYKFLRYLSECPAYEE